jgi:hypothetical protein
VTAPDPFLELAPLAALDALDGEDARAFADHLRGCEACRREHDAFAAAAGEMARATPPVAPPPMLRARVLGAAGFAPLRAPRWPLAVAAALAAAFGVGLIAVLQEREIERQRRLHAALAHEDLVGLLSDAGSRTVALAALPAAPGSAARVVWNPDKRRAVLFASGLEPAPPGKAYEVWVIAGSAPVPSGLFQVDDRGRAVADLPWLEQTPGAKTFAITLKPATGTPAPTGPMVLAGNVT